jgi:hypothetical protein
MCLQWTSTTKIAKLAVIGSDFRRFGSDETATMAEIHDIGGFIMTAQTSVTVRPSITEQTDHVLLRRVFFADAAFSTVSGLTFAIFSRPIEAFLGGDQPDVLMVIGIVLVVFAVFNFTTARETPLNRTKAWFIFEFNVLWVIASVVAIATNMFDLNTIGNVGTLIVALGVAGIAVIEWIGLRRGQTQQ